jgi:hypothetical protein
MSGAVQAALVQAPEQERRDFWLSCGHHLLDRGKGGGLVVTDAFLKAYLARPELIPPPEACAVERTLHAALMTDPRRPVEPAVVLEIADEDARENWRTLIAFRDQLLAHPTLEAAYLDLMRRGAGKTPPLFINQLVHAILRNMLHGAADPHLLRAAELFFRPQRLTAHDGSLIAADEELVAGTGAPPASPLVAMLGRGTQTIDVMVDSNAEEYWARSDRFDMGLDLTAGRPGLAALGEVIARWITHLLATRVAVAPVTELKNAKLTWYVGLDAEGTRIGDALWNGEVPDASVLSRIAGIFRLVFQTEEDVIDRARGEPVYLIMAMAPDMTLRLKPQNLVTGLPLSRTGSQT